MAGAGAGAAGAVTLGLLWLGLVGDATLFAVTSALLIVGARRCQRQSLERRHNPAGDTALNAEDDNNDNPTA